MKKIKITSKKSDPLTASKLDDQIIASGSLPEALELSLEDYLSVADEPAVVYQPDGLYYKGIRLTVKNG